MSYAIYLRKSRADMELEKMEKYETLARHKKILLVLARKREFDIVKIYEEIVSGESIRQRPEMQKLLQDVSNELYEGVLVMEVERLARGNTRDQGIVAETFQYSGTKIITPNKVYDPNNDLDQEYFEFGLFMSRREYKTILNPDMTSEMYIISGLSFRRIVSFIISEKSVISVARHIELLLYISFEYYIC